MVVEKSKQGPNGCFTLTLIIIGIFVVMAIVGSQVDHPPAAQSHAAQSPPARFVPTTGHLATLPASDMICPTKKALIAWSDHLTHAYSVHDAVGVRHATRHAIDSGCAVTMVPIQVLVIRASYGFLTRNTMRVRYLSNGLAGWVFMDSLQAPETKHAAKNRHDPGAEKAG